MGIARARFFSLQPRQYWETGLKAGQISQFLRLKGRFHVSTVYPQKALFTLLSAIIKALSDKNLKNLPSFGR
jgi:hypothetical protein